MALLLVALVASATVVPLLSAVDDPGVAVPGPQDERSGSEADIAVMRKRKRRRHREEDLFESKPKRAAPDAPRFDGPRDPVFFFHFRKAGGTSIMGSLKRAGCAVAHQEWTPLEASPRKEVYSLTNLRHPISRLLSAYVFEGAAPQCACRDDGGDADCGCGDGLEPCEARVAELDVNTFPDWLAKSRARQDEALRHQVASRRFDQVIFRDGTRDCGQVEGGRRCYVGHHCVRHYIRNYYTRMLLSTDASVERACGPVEGDLTDCHVQAALHKLRTMFDCVVVFHDGKVHRVSPPDAPGACDARAPTCVGRIDWSNLPVFSSDGYYHEETPETDGELIRLRRAHVAQLKDTFPDEIAALEAENQADMALFRAYTAGLERSLE